MVEYLEQTNSIVYNEQDKSHENFTFSQHLLMNNNEHEEQAE